MSETTKTPSYREGYNQLRKEFEEWLPESSLALFDGNAKNMGADFINPLKLAVGQKAPDFTLPNALGKQVSLQDYVDQGSVIITFYRGVWCPYCNLILKQYQEILPAIKELGGNLLAISPQTPDNSLSTKEKNELAFEVLSDTGNKVAKQYVHVFEGDAAVTEDALKLGFDIADFNGSDKVELPVPAVYIIDHTGVVVFAKSEGGDYRSRVEPEELLQFLRSIQN